MVINMILNAKHLNIRNNSLSVREYYLIVTDLKMGQFYLKSIIYNPGLHDSIIQTGGLPVRLTTGALRVLW